MMNKTPFWIYFALMILGLWQMATTLSFHLERGFMFYSDFFSGILLILLSFMARRHPRTSLHWAIALVGLWMQFTPLAFWENSSAVFLNNTLVGCLAITLSVILFPLPGQVPDEEPSIPPGWSYNPSSTAQRLPIALLAFVCWMISRYLSAYQLGYIDTVWDPFFGEGTKDVLTSSVSKAFPVSDAGLGAFAYMIEFFSVCQGGKSRWRTAPWLVLLFGFLVIPVGLVSITLIILQPLAVGHWCSLCLLTAFCMLIPIPLAIDEVWASLQYLRKHSLKVLFSGGLCPSASIDHKTPAENAPLHIQFKASLLGVSFPWQLFLSALLGLFLMATPSLLELSGPLKDIDPILGALTAAISVTSLAEHARPLRWINSLFAAALLVLAWFFADQPLLHSLIALVIFLSIFRQKN